MRRTTGFRHDNPAKASGFQRLGWSFLYVLMGAAAVVTAMAVLPPLEARFFPVVKEFHATTLVRNGNTVIGQGTLDKVRDCRFIELLAYAGQNGVDFKTPIRVDFSPSNDAMQTRLAIPQEWGPWAFLLPAAEGASIVLAARHECHAFYTTTTYLAKFEVP